jgi:hypothetical protein
LKLKVSKREFHTILAALRQRQFILGKVPGGASVHAVRGIANNMGKVEPLTEREIDAFCERLNFESED